jgi:hypothetical protein
MSYGLREPHQQFAYPVMLFLRGTVVETIGNLTGAESWQTSGKEEHAQGEAEYNAAQAKVICLFHLIWELVLKATFVLGLC